MATEHTGGGFVSCLDVKINPDGDVTTDCLPLLMRIRPGWSGKDIKHEVSVGMSSQRRSSFAECKMVIISL